MKMMEYVAEPVMNKPHESATALVGRKSVDHVCMALGISPTTYHRWQKIYGGKDLGTVGEYKASNKRMHC
jgi:hypothetical protein